MSKNNPKYKRLETLLSGATPAEPNPASPAVSGSGEVDSLKAKVASLEAALEASRSKQANIPAAAEPHTQIPAPRRDSARKNVFEVRKPAAAKEQAVIDPISNEQRRKNMEVMTVFMAWVAGFAVLFYFGLFLATGVWQILAESFFIFTGLAALILVVRPQVKRGQFQEASTWLLAALMFAYLAPELVWKNATTYLLVGGMLLLFVMSQIYPPKPVAWLVIPVFFLLDLAVANILEPLPRFDINQSPFLQAFVPGITIVIGVWAIGQLSSSVLRYVKEESSSSIDNTRTDSASGKSLINQWGLLSKAFSRLFVEPDKTVIGVENRRTAQLLTTILSVIFPLYMVGQIFRSDNDNEFTLLTNSAIAISLLAAYGLSRTNLSRIGALLTVLALNLSIYGSLPLFRGEAMDDYSILSSFLWIFLPLAISSIILTFRTMVIFMTLNAIAMIALAFVPGIPTTPLFISTVMVIISSITLIFGRQFRERIEQESQAKLIATNENLEASERISQSLNQNLYLAAEVGRRLSQLRELSGMLTDAAELIRSNFDLYYVQVYLTNPNQTSLVLESGTGSVGMELLRRSHRLNLDGSSINGRAAIEKRAVIVQDTTASGFFRPNPLLPETRSEMAVPLLVGERVVGVLDLQSREAGALNDDVLPAFETLAGQLAIAIQNAQLFAETELARTEVEAQARRLARSNWNEYLNAIHKPERTGYVFDQDQIIPLAEANLPSTTANTIATPIEVTGESIGTFAVELEQEKWTAEAKELIQTVTRQVAQQVENLRLLEAAERYRAEAENITRRLTHEGWQEYSATREQGILGYTYDLEKVIPLGDNGHVDPAQTVTVPLSIRDEPIGQLVLHKNTSEEVNEVIDAVAKQLSSHLENLRLSEQNEIRAAELEKLVIQLRELDRLKSSFLANMSHELRTPLNSILGFTDVMLEELDGPLTPNMDNDLRLIQKNGKHLLHLINDVLDMAKIESGKMNLVVEKFNLDETIDDVMNITSPLASERSIALFTDPESDRDVFIRADHTRLRQVLINLVNNGIKFTDRGGVSIRVKHMGNNVQIAVKDTGIGISTDHLDAVFQEFTQVDSSTTRKAGGTGLGLPISRRLIEMHGGRLWAESTGVEGEGSTFFISMPVEAVVAEAAVSEPLTKK